MDKTSEVILSYFFFKKSVGKKSEDMNMKSLKDNLLAIFLALKFWSWVSITVRKMMNK